MDTKKDMTSGNPPSVPTCTTGLTSNSASFSSFSSFMPLAWMKAWKHCR